MTDILEAHRLEVDFPLRLPTAGDHCRPQPPDRRQKPQPQEDVLPEGEFLSLFVGIKVQHARRERGGGRDRERALVRRKGLLKRRKGSKFNLSAEQTREKGVPVLQAGFLTLEKLSNIQ